MSRELNLVSVVIPIRNGMDTLPDQLVALAAQTYDEPFEVVLSDNGSTDGLSIAALQERCPDAVAGLRLRVSPALGRPGVSHARNAGSAAAEGELILICDADDLVTPDWVADLVAASARADLIGGSLGTDVLNPPVVQEWRPIAEPGVLPSKLDFLPFVQGANIAVWKDVVEAIGGWDEELVAGGDDVDFSWRAQLAGFSIIAITGGLVHYRLRHDLPGMAKQVYRYSRTDAQLLRKFAPDGAKGQGLLRTAKNAFWFVKSAGLLRTPGGRGAYVYRGAQFAGRIVGSVRYRAWV